MLSPEEVRVRESLFSSVSSDQAWATSRGVSDGDGVGGASYGCVPTAEVPYPLPAHNQGAGTQRTTATAASTAYIPKSSVSRSGWKGQRGRPWRSVFARKPRSSRRAIVAAPWTSPVAAHHLAAVQVREAEHVVPRAPHVHMFDEADAEFNTHIVTFIVCYPAHSRLDVVAKACGRNI